MFSDWKERFDFFSQEGEGEFRKYCIPNRKKSTKEKEVVKKLPEIIASRKAD